MLNLSLMQILHSLVVPPLSLVLLLLFGYAIKRLYPRCGRGIITLALLALIALSTNVGALLLVQPLEALEKPLLDSGNISAQAIVVLTAGRLRNNPEYDYKDVPDHVGLARMRYAAKLYRDTRLPILVTGGLGNKTEHIDSLAAGMASGLSYEFGLPVKWIEEQSSNTQENAVFSARILKQAGVKHILLVTDAMHMRRARIAFEQAGMQVTPAPTQFFSHSELHFFAFLPSAEGMRRSQYAVYEWLGLAWYWLVHS
jgi:uncharacterized SAM-binding protein YcdF (DUF218 family)